MGWFTERDKKRKERAIKAAQESEFFGQAVKAKSQAELEYNKALADLRRYELEYEHEKQRLNAGYYKPHNVEQDRYREWSSEHPVVDLWSIKDNDIFRSGFFAIEGPDGDCVEMVVPIGKKARVNFNVHRTMFNVCTLDDIILLDSVPVDASEFREYATGGAVDEDEIAAARAALKALGE